MNQKMGEHYDIIIIGTGAGGGTLTHVLAPSGKKILVLERGSFLFKKTSNFNSRSQNSHTLYRASESWHDKNHVVIHPTIHYFVGGNTKVYGGALFRLRQRDFETVIHHDGISPAWGLNYSDFAPYYTQAEKLYEVHGQSGLDPTEPPFSEDYPFPPVSHEPYIQNVCDALKDKQLHPFYIPLAIKLNEKDPFSSTCIRCGTCDGYPCVQNAKADADINAVRPALNHPNLTLITHAKVVRLHTSASGREVTQVEAEIAGKQQFFSADIIVMACGAINSAILLLQSANDRHPNGLANRSQQVGRNFMIHNHAVVMALSRQVNPTIFQKTIAVHDFYWGDKKFSYPMGGIQLLGSINKSKIAAYAPPLLPDRVCETIAKHSVAWLLTTEDLPKPNNRIYIQKGNIILDYKRNNLKAFNQLIKRWVSVLRSIDPLSWYATRKMPLKEIAHQCGTCRFGEDPKTSVLDLNCRTHDVNNLYIVDGSFFPSSAALNPSLTIMANALRVGNHLLEQLK
jgi:choline dehydrogenase-like flavoprotein